MYLKGGGSAVGLKRRYHRHKASVLFGGVKGDILCFGEWDKLKT